MRWVTAGGVNVHYSPAAKRAAYSGLQVCGSVWACPVCSARIAERRKQELRIGTDTWAGMGGKVVMVTYTLRHKRTDRLEDTLAELEQVRAETNRGRAAVALRKRYQVTGMVRALEVTHGANGWHPHLHVLYFVPASVDTEQFADALWASWSGHVARLGYPAVDRQAFDVTDCDERVAEYISKFGHEPKWRHEDEVSKSVSKRGGKKTFGSHPFDLLEEYTRGGNVASGRLFKEYVKCFHGRVHLRWSNGLRALFGIKEKSDEAIAAAIDFGSYVLAVLDLEQWRIVLSADRRGELLDVASSGDVERVWAFLETLGGARPAAEQAPVTPGANVFMPMALRSLHGPELAAVVT